VTASADVAFIRRFLGRVEAFAPPTVSGGRMMPNGAFQFSFNGPASQPYRVLATTNLSDAASWVVVMSGSFGSQAGVFTETNVFSPSARFYRLVSP